MSRIAPDIPELQHVPEAIRSLVYMQALHHAIRSPLTWVMGAIVAAISIGIGVTQGRVLLGGAGAAVGAVLGITAAVWCVVKVIVPWRTRRVLPSAIAQAGGHTLEPVQRADQNLRRMVDAYDTREGAGTDEPRRK